MAFPLKGAPNQGVDGSLDAIVNSENDYVRYFHLLSILFFFFLICHLTDGGMKSLGSAG